jgi:TRAP-type C4-dicarboxylate transport system substrate-binding protein
LRKAGILIGAAVFAALATPANAETTMRAIAFIPHKHPVMISSHDWVNRVNAALKGKLKINYIGGPEVIGRREQWDAAKNGVIDIIFAVFADIQDRAPATASSWLSKCSIPHERETGLFAHLDAEMKKLNLKLLARVQYGNFYLWVNKNPKTLADLHGLKMRTGSLYDNMMQKLGMVPVTMNSPAVYTALERGVVDGFGWPNIGPRKRGWVKKAKWVIDLPFFGNSNMGAIMNLDKWNALPADVRKTITEISIKYEPEMVDYYRSAEAAEWKKLAEHVTKVKFSAAENKTYIDAAYETEWSRLESKVGAEKVKELKKLSCN